MSPSKLVKDIVFRVSSRCSEQDRAKLIVWSEGYKVLVARQSVAFLEGLIRSCIRQHVAYGCIVCNLFFFLVINKYFELPKKIS